jgi:WD40 repeat protein/tetratricopeptide (TPR) repeat protein
VPRTDCLTPDELRAFHLGDLADTVLDDVADHLDRCPRCEAAARALDALTDPVIAAVQACTAARDDPPAEEVPPERVGDYEVLGPIGRGGMAVVYRARHRELRREVALKMLLGGEFADRPERLRFRIEAEAVARLQHPNIVQIYEVGEHDGGNGLPHPYFTLELVDGGSLAQRLAAGPPLPRQAAAWLEALARAAHYAHGQGVVHRDLKPANVLLTRDGTPKLCDFGVAKLLTGSAVHTRSGMLVGTAEYMAPEQAAGDTDVGPAADVYALGAILYEMLAGRPPFRGGNPLDTLLHVRVHDPQPPRTVRPGVPADLETVCLKCLEKDPHRRYPSAQALADDLRRFLAGEPVTARPVGALGRAARWARRRPALAGLLATVVVLLLGGTAVSTYFAVEAGGRARDADRARRQAEANEAEALEARRQSDLRAAERTFATALAEAEAGRVDAGLFGLIEALRLAPADAADFRRVVCTNLAAWSDRLPVLRQVVAGHRDAAFVGRDGKTFATLSGKRYYRWDVATGRPVGPASGQEYPAPSRGPWQAGLTPDGGRVSIREGEADDFRVRVWDAARGAFVGEPFTYRRATPGERLNWAGLDLGSDDAPPAVIVRVPTQDADGLRFWDVATGAALGPLVPLAGLESYRLVRDRDGRVVLLVFRAAGPAEFWDLSASRRLPALPELAGLDRTVRPGGGALGSVAADGTVRRFDPATGQPLGQPWRPARCLKDGRLTPDGRVLVAGCTDGRIRLFDLAARQPYATTIPAGFGPTKTLVPSPDGTAVLAFDQCSVRLWDLGELALPAPAAGGEPAAGGAALDFTTMAYSPDRRTAFVGGAGPNRDDGGRLVELATGRPLGRPLPGAGSPWRQAGQATAPLVVDGPTFSPDGTLLATCARLAADGWPLDARVWDAATGRPRTPPLRFPRFVHALAFSPDGHTLATGHGGETVLWDVATGQARAVLPQAGPVSALAFSPDGRRLAAASRSGWGNQPGFRLWDAASGKPVGDLVPAAAPLLHFRADGTLETFDREAGRLCRYDGATGQPRGPVVAFAPWQEPLSVAFRADGRRLATGSLSGVAQQWDTDTGRPLGPAMAHGFPVVGLEYSPDGRSLAVGCGDDTARLWDAATSLPLGPPHRNPAGLLGMTFGPQGRTLLATGRDGVTRAAAVPEPLPDDPDRLTLWLSATTGLRAEGGTRTEMDMASWEESRRLLRQRWPEAERSPGPPGGLEAWHDRRARDAFQAGDAAAECWHLDRLLALGADDWLPFARRARAHRALGDSSRAEADEAQAAGHGGGAALLDWYRHQARVWALLGRDETAVEYLDRLVAALPGDWELYAERAGRYARLGKAAEQERDEARAVSGGADRDYLTRLAGERAAADRWREAADLCARAAAAGEPLNVAACYRQGLALLKTGDRAGHRRLCARLLREAGTAGPGLRPGAANAVAMLCALAPGAVTDWDAPLALVRQALAALDRAAVGDEERRQLRHAWLNTEGGVLYRAGRYREAVERLTEAVAAEGHGGTVEDWIFLALAHDRLGERDRAREWWARGAAAKPGGDHFSWEGVEVDVLRREAGGRFPPEAADRPK